MTLNMNGNSLPGFGNGGNTGVIFPGTNTIGLPNYQTGQVQMSGTVEAMQNPHFKISGQQPSMMRSHVLTLDQTNVGRPKTILVSPSSTYQHEVNAANDANRIRRLEFQVILAAPVRANDIKIALPITHSIYWQLDSDHKTTLESSFSDRNFGSHPFMAGLRSIENIKIFVGKNWLPLATNENITYRDLIAYMKIRSWTDDDFKNGEDMMAGIPWSCIQGNYRVEDLKTLNPTTASRVILGNQRPGLLETTRWSQKHKHIYYDFIMTYNDHFVVYDKDKPNTSMLYLPLKYMHSFFNSAVFLPQGFIFKIVLSINTFPRHYVRFHAINNEKDNTGDGVKGDPAWFIYRPLNEAKLIYHTLAWPQTSLDTLTSQWASAPITHQFYEFDFYSIVPQPADNYTEFTINGVNNTPPFVLLWMEYNQSQNMITDDWKTQCNDKWYADPGLEMADGKRRCLKFWSRSPLPFNLRKYRIEQNGVITDQQSTEDDPLHNDSQTYGYRNYGDVSYSDSQYAWLMNQQAVTEGVIEQRLLHKQFAVGDCAMILLTNGAGESYQPDNIIKTTPLAPSSYKFQFSLSQTRSMYSDKGVVSMKDDIDKSQYVMILAIPRLRTIKCNMDGYALAVNEPAQLTTASITSMNPLPNILGNMNVTGNLGAPSVGNVNQA